MLGPKVFGRHERDERREGARRERVHHDGAAEGRPVPIRIGEHAARKGRAGPGHLAELHHDIPSGAAGGVDVVVESGPDEAAARVHECAADEQCADDERRAVAEAHDAKGELARHNV